MTDTVENRKRFAEIMMGIADNFGGKITKEGMKIRFAILSEYHIDQIEAAGNWLLRNREATFPALPTIKEFIDAIELQAGPQISAKARAEIQADEVLRKVRFEGRNGTVDFEDPITFKLMTTRWIFNSWAANLMEADTKWWRKEFIEAYQAYAEQEKAQTQRLEGPARFIALAGTTTQEVT